MSQLIFTIIGGVITAVVVSWFGIGGTKRVVVHGTKVRRSGKWIIFFSVIAIIAGLSWAGSDPINQTYGYTLAGYGALAYITGRIIAWFQKM
jgi:hypothetical protein